MKCCRYGTLLEKQKERMLGDEDYRKDSGVVETSKPKAPPSAVEESTFSSHEREREHFILLLSFPFLFCVCVSKYMKLLTRNAQQQVDCKRQDPRVHLRRNRFDLLPPSARRSTSLHSLQCSECVLSLDLV